MKTIQRITYLTLILLVGMGCRTLQQDPVNSKTQSSKRFLPSQFTEEGYSSGVEHFSKTFCNNTNKVNYQTAHWLAKFASNQYAHFGILGPELEKLGFGDPGEGNSWGDFWYDLDYLRMAQEVLSYRTREDGKLVLDDTKSKNQQFIDRTLAMVKNKRLIKMNGAFHEGQYDISTFTHLSKQLEKELTELRSRFQNGVNAYLLKLNGAFTLARIEKKSRMLRELLAITREIPADTAYGQSYKYLDDHFNRLYAHNRAKQKIAEYEKANQGIATPADRIDTERVEELIESINQFDKKYEIVDASTFELNLIQIPRGKINFFSSGKFSMPEKGIIFPDTPSLFENGSTQVMMVQHGTLPIIIISFRGTEPDEVNDIFTDLFTFKDKESSQMQWSDSEVHQGFNHAHRNTAAKLIWQKLQSLTLHHDKKWQVWITGHSLGGALATLQTSYLLKKVEDLRNQREQAKWNHNWYLRGVYTFGSPRVGNLGYYQHFQRSAQKSNVGVHRFRNQSDIVTRIPGAGFSHVGSLSYIDADRIFSQNDQIRRLSAYEKEGAAKCAEKRLGMFECLYEKAKLGDDINNHTMGEYVAKIGQEIMRLKNKAPDHESINCPQVEIGTKITDKAPWFPAEKN